MSALCVFCYACVCFCLCLPCFALRFIVDSILCKLSVQFARIQFVCALALSALLIFGQDFVLHELWPVVLFQLVLVCSVGIARCHVFAASFTVRFIIVCGIVVLHLVSCI